MKQM